ARGSNPPNAAAVSLSSRRPLPGRPTPCTRRPTAPTLPSPRGHPAAPGSRPGGREVGVAGDGRVGAPRRLPQLPPGPARRTDSVDSEAHPRPRGDPAAPGAGPGGQGGGVGGWAARRPPPPPGSADSARSYAQPCITRAGIIAAA
ncbi:unnamed protein product, partial [Rangifer tarandus platyrhynchus]